MPTVGLFVAAAAAWIFANSAAQAAPGPKAVFDAYVAAVEAQDAKAVDALIADHAAKPPFYQCPAGADDRRCLVDYLTRTVVERHTKFTTLNTRVEDDTVFAKIEVRNDATRAAGVDRFAGVDRVKVKDGKIAEFAFLRDEHDPQTMTFFQYLASQRR